MPPGRGSQVCNRNERQTAVVYKTWHQQFLKFVMYTHRLTPLRARLQSDGTHHTSKNQRAVALFVV